MDLRRLRTFVAVAEQGTVSKASLDLRTAQPALSRQIRDLESELGIKLFDRIRRRLILTPEGEQLLDDCRTVLGTVQSLAERAQLLRRGDRGILRVAATPQSIDGVLASFLIPYAQRRPNVQIKLVEAVGSTLVSMLERGEVHVTVGVIQSSQIDNPSIESLPLSPLEFLAVSQKPLAATGAGNIDIKHLAAYPLLLLHTDFSVRQTFDAACRLAGVKLNIFLESRAPHTLLALAEAGHGVAIVPSVLPMNRYHVRVARIMHRHVPLRATYAVLWDKRRPLPPYAADFCELLVDHTRKIFTTVRSTITKNSGISRRRESAARQRLDRGVRRAAPEHSQGSSR